MGSIKPYWQNFIDGNFCDGGAGRIAVENPATGEVLAEQALADETDIERAVMAARQVADSAVLYAMRPADRGRMVRRMGEFLLDNEEEIARLLTLEAGKTYWEALGEVREGARYFEYYGGQAETLEGRSVPLGENYLDFTMREPYGVSAQIIPWNFPIQIASRSLAAGLATANACVVKTPELDPLSSSYLAKAAQEAGFPAGAVNILCGVGPVAGAALSAHPGVDQIVFTGSVETGSAIAMAAAQNIVPCVLELGGKSAAIAAPDTDIKSLVANVRKGIFLNAGQVCSAMSRLIVHEDIHDEVVEGVCAMAKNLSPGPGIERTRPLEGMGAMISEKQCARAASMCANAQRDGAVAATGGHRLNRPGYFLQPTVMTGVEPDMEIAQVEVFGPVLSVLKYRNEDEAVAMANGTQYGLVAGVFTRDLDLATSLARRLRAGQVFVNEWFAGGVETPFGGYEKSGYGREKGREALLNYVQTKNIAIACRS